MKRKIHGSESPQKPGYQPELKGGLWTGKYIESDEVFSKRITTESNVLTLNDVLKLLLIILICPLYLAYTLGTIENLSDDVAVTIMTIMALYGMISYRSVVKKFKVK